MKADTRQIAKAQNYQIEKLISENGLSQ